MEARTNRLIKWIGDKVKESRKDGIIMGLSGGIDSAVLNMLCVKAINPDKVLALILPCKSNQQDEEHAKLVYDVSKCQVKKICLDYVFGVSDAILSNAFSNGNRKLAQANLKARLRMLVQYYVANSLNYLVAGSDDKSENYVGYFTKYGDGASDFAPLGNLTKTEVRRLAIELNVPQVVIEKPSSPGLWNNQVAENELGINYCDLDSYLCGKYDDLVISSKIELRHRMTEHKRQMPYIPEF